MSAPDLVSLAPRDLSALVTAVFERWRREGIEFLILRNYEGLPKETSNDVDVLVSPAQLAKAERALIEQARATGFVLHNRVEFLPVSLFFHHKASRQQVQFDLFHCLKWRGFRLLSERLLLGARIDRGLFATPHPGHEAVNSMLSVQIYQGYVKEKYKPAIAAGIRRFPGEATEALREMFGLRLARELVQAVQLERWAAVERRTKVMRWHLVWRRTFRQPLATMLSVGSDLQRLAHRLWQPPGITVVLLGPDGSGKSTIASMLVKTLENTFHSGKSLQGHWKPEVFFRRRQGGPVTDPHGRRPRAQTASLIVLSCHWLEFLVGIPWRFLPILFCNGLVLMDRYHYDLAVDPRRFRLQVSAKTVCALFQWLPAPDLVFVLDAAAEVLQARKQEVPVEETRRQRAAFRQLAATLPRAQVVDCSQTPESVVRHLEGVILDYMAARQARRSRR